MCSEGGIMTRLIGSRLHCGRGVVDTLIDGLAGWKYSLVCGDGMGETAASVKH